MTPNPETAQELERTCGECAFLGTPECKYANMIPKRQATDTDASCCEKFHSNSNIISTSASSENKQIGIPSAGEKFGNIIFEQINTGEYVIKTGETLSYSREINREQGHYRPLSYTPWTLPPKPEEYDFERLYSEIYTFVFDRLDLTDERLYDVMVCWIFASWRQEDFNTAPILYFLGSKESGKSRAQEILKALAYRGIDTAIMTPASLFRVTQLFRPTLLIDEVEMLGKNPELKALLNGRYRRGLKICRTQKNGEGKYDPEFFDVFGFTSLASTNSFHDTLESRCIKFSMMKNVRKVTQFDPEKCPELDTLRAKLLMYRLKNLGQPLPQIDLENVTTNSRLTELFLPLMSVAPENKARTLMECVTDITRERKEEDECGAEALILRAVLATRSLAQGNRLRLKDVSDKLNEEISDRNERWKSRTVGKILGRLGFKRARMPDKQGSKGILLEERHLQRQSQRYGVTDFCPPSNPPGLVKLVRLVRNIGETPISSDQSDQSDRATGIKSSLLVGEARH